MREFCVLEKMEDATTRPRSSKSPLNEDRSFFTSASVRSEIKDSSVVAVYGKVAREVVFRHCVSFVEDFHQLEIAKMNFESKDWTVVKGVVELLVRCGIYPYLSVGVGIPLHRRFGEKAAASAAAAISKRALHDASASASGASASDLGVLDRALETHPLVASAELISSLALESSSEKCTGTITSEPWVNVQAQEMDDKVRGSNGPAEEDDPTFSLPEMTLQQLVLSHHLVDVLAALLQAAHGPWVTITSASEIWKKNAAEIIQTMMRRLPVAHLVEALFILLGDAQGPKPPSWVQSEVGKLLSLAVMRDGGIVAVMERLVGRAEKGSLAVFKRVAAQLARVPRLVSTKDLYYKAVCMQLQSLILSKSHSTVGGSSNIASSLLSNIHQTSILLACNLAQQDPKLVEQYFTRPIVEPLYFGDALQPQSEMSSMGSIKRQACTGLQESRSTDFTETEVVNSLLKLQVLITTGHKGSHHVRQQLLRLTSLCAPRLLWLKYALWLSSAKPDAGSPLEQVGRESKSGEGLVDEPSRQKAELKKSQKEFAKGFLIGRSLSTHSNSESKDELPGSLPQVLEAISDIVHAHLSERTEWALPLVCSFLFNSDGAMFEWPSVDGEIVNALNAERAQPDSKAPLVCSFLFNSDGAMFEWPSVDGEIANALNAGRAQPDSKAMFLSKLLLGSENWKLAIAILGKLLSNILMLRRSTQMEARKIRLSCQVPDGVVPESILQSLQTLEVMYAEVGLKAVEHNASRALLLLQEFLNVAEVMADVEILDVVLMLLHAALSQLHQGQGGCLKDQQETVLINIQTSLTTVQQSVGVSEKHKQFAARLMTTICEMSKDFASKP